MQVGESPDISVPLAHHVRFQPDRPRGHSPGIGGYGMGRLAPARRPARCARRWSRPPGSGARRLARGRSRTAPGCAMPEPPTLAADPGAQGENDVRRQVRRPLHILMGLVGLVLAAAAPTSPTCCSRAAPRAAARSRCASRSARAAAASSASSSTESLLLAFAGAALGTALAWWGRGLLLALRPFGKRRSCSICRSTPACSASRSRVTVATALLFGLAPALRATRVDLRAQFQGGTRTLGGGGRSRLSQALMVVQIALSLVLLVSTGLFVRTLGNLQNVDPGFNRRGLVLFRIDATSAGYAPEQFAALHARVQERLERLPACAPRRSRASPCWPACARTGGSPCPATCRPRRVDDRQHQRPRAEFFRGHGDAAGPRPRLHRRDDAAAPRVAVVNQAFARTYLGGENPIGRRSASGRRRRIGSRSWASRATPNTPAARPTPATIYLPALQRLDGNANFACAAAAGRRARGRLCRHPGRRA